MWILVGLLISLGLAFVGNRTNDYYKIEGMPYRILRGRSLIQFGTVVSRRAGALLFYFR